MAVPAIPQMEQQAITQPQTALQVMIHQEVIQPPIAQQEQILLQTVAQELTPQIAQPILAQIVIVLLILVLAVTVQLTQQLIAQVLILPRILQLMVLTQILLQEQIQQQILIRLRTVQTQLIIHNKLFNLAKELYQTAIMTLKLILQTISW